MTKERREDCPAQTCPRHTTLLRVVFGEEGVDGDVPVTEVATDVPRRNERRGREPDELCDCVFDREDADSSVSGGSVLTACDMMSAMRGRRIFRPEDGVVVSLLVGTGLGVTGLAAAGVIDAGFSFFGGSTGVEGPDVDL